MRFSIATALSPHCGVVAVEVRFVRDGELQGLKQGGQLVPYGSLCGARQPEVLIRHSSLSSPKDVVSPTCRMNHFNQEGQCIIDQQAEKKIQYYWASLLRDAQRCLKNFVQGSGTVTGEAKHSMTVCTG